MHALAVGGSMHALAFESRDDEWIDHGSRMDVKHLGICCAGHFHCLSQWDEHTSPVGCCTVAGAPS